MRRCQQCRLEIVLIPAAGRPLQPGGPALDLIAAYIQPDELEVVPRNDPCAGVGAENAELDQESVRRKVSLDLSQRERLTVRQSPKRRGDDGRSQYEVQRLESARPFRIGERLF